MLLIINNIMLNSMAQLCKGFRVHAGTVVLDRAGQRRTPRFCLRRASYTQADNAIAGVLCGVVQNVGKRRSEAVLKSDFEVV